MECYWLWVWTRSTLKSGWCFDTKEEAEYYFNRHFRNEPLVKHEIIFEIA